MSYTILLGSEAFLQSPEVEQETLWDRGFVSSFVLLCIAGGDCLIVHLIINNCNN